jgi:hypothetical protein
VRPQSGRAVEMVMWESVPVYDSGAWFEQRRNRSAGESSGGCGRCYFNQEEGTKARRRLGHKKRLRITEHSQSDGAKRKTRHDTPPSLVRRRLMVTGPATVQTLGAERKTCSVRGHQARRGP